MQYYRDYQQYFINNGYYLHYVYFIINIHYSIIPNIYSTYNTYFYSYQSADGTQRQESGGLKYPPVPGYPPVMSVQGSYSSITPEGIEL